MHTRSWIIHETYNLEMDILNLYCLPLLVWTMGRSPRPVQPKYDDHSIYLPIYCWCCNFFLARLILVGLVDLSAPPSRETSCLCKQLACCACDSFDRVGERVTSRACGYTTPTSIFYHMQRISLTCPRAPGPPPFSACNIEKVGVAWGQG